MFVHVVKPGETLFSIAKRYGGTAERIRAANELQDDQLIPGCSLVIPAGLPTYLRAYQPAAGEDLETMAKKFKVPPFVIQGANTDWDGHRTSDVQTVWIPQPIKQPATIEVNAYLVPTSSASDMEILEDVRECLTYVSLFSYQLRADGTLVEPDDEAAIAESRKHIIAPLMTVTNFNESRFDPELARTVLASSGSRRTACQHIIETAKRKGFSGINLDFEHVYPGDRGAYNAFLRELAGQARLDGLAVSATVGPKMSDDPRNPWLGAFDYRTIGEVADHVTLMTFEWGWAGGPPMAIAPLNHVRGVLEYASTLIPPEKIFMGMALYGYNWPLPFKEGNHAVGISPKAAANLAVRTNGHIHFPDDSASPMFTYRGPRGEMRQVWFEDARSVLAKFQLVNEFGLRGISYWMLGHPFPQNWLLLNDTFRIQKKADF